MPPTSNMLFLTYIPRADVDSRGYDPWVRDIDNPFFNASEGIAHYSNWKFRDVPLGEWGCTHFDFMFLDDDSTFEQVFGQESVAAFAQGWVDLWGRAPDSTDLADNAHVHRCEPVAVPPSGFRCDKTLVVCATKRRPDADHAKYEAWVRSCAQPFLASLPGVTYAAHWRIVESKVGASAFSDLDVLLLDTPEAAAALASSGDLREFATLWHGDWAAPGGSLGESAAVAVCTLIGAPPA